MNINFKWKLNNRKWLRINQQSFSKIINAEMSFYNIEVNIYISNF